MAKELTTDQRLDKIDYNLEKIVTIVNGHDNQLKKIVTIVDGHDNQLKKIIKIVDGHDNQLKKIIKIVDGHDNQLNKITTTVVKGFERIDKTLGTKADTKDLQRIFNLLDKISKQQEIDNDERLVMGYQLDRLDRWVHEVADKIGHKLTV